MIRPLLFALCLGLSLGGCGGGGEAAPAASTPAAPATPPAPPQTATLSATSITRTVVSYDPAPVDESISFTLTNPAAEFWYRVSSELSVIDSGDVMKTLTGGKLSLRLTKPSRLGPGTYKTNVTLTLCGDEKCAVTLQGTPATIALTYVITGDAQQDTNVRWQSEPFSTEFETKNTQDIVFKLNVSVGELPMDGLLLARSASQTGLVKSIVFGAPQFADPSAYGTYTVTLKPPAALGSGHFTDSITIRVCLDDNCDRDLPSARFVLQPKITVYASEGVELTSKSRKPFNGAQSIAWADAQQRFYVASSTYTNFGGRSAELLALDPATLDTTSAVNLGTSALQQLAVASDGLGLYLTTQTAPALRHLQLPALTQDYSVDLGTVGPTGNYPRVVHDLLPVAGEPASVILSLAYDNRGAGLIVYDGVTPRPVSIPASQVVSSPRWITRGDTSTTFYSARLDPAQPAEIAIDRLLLDPSGITRAAVAPSTIFPGPLQFASGKLYDLQGGVRDPMTAAVIDHVVLPDGYEMRDYILDPGHDRLFVVATRSSGSNLLYLLSFKLSSRTFLAVARMSSVPGAFSGLEHHLILWGNQGLAYSDGEQIVVMAGSLFTTYDGAPTMPNPAPSF